MSTETQKLVQICEQLSETMLAEVTDFAQFLLSKNHDAADRSDQLERWLARATGASNTDMTTGQIMALTRGEP